MVYLKAYDCGIVIQLLCFRTLLIVLFLSLKQRFGEWILSPSSVLSDLETGTSSID
jgi:hypothetical protein